LLADYTTFVFDAVSGAFEATGSGIDDMALVVCKVCSEPVTADQREAIEAAYLEGEE
jgi:hypothetical protein